MHIMAERGSEKITEWLDIKLVTLSSEERLRLIEEIFDTLTAQELRVIRDVAEQKSHPLEGSCQEAIPLPSTTFAIFSVAFREAHSTPDWPSQTHPCFHSRGVGSDAPHQSPIRLKAS
jgi:hypothetical protein